MDYDTNFSFPLRIRCLWDECASNSSTSNDVFPCRSRKDSAHFCACCGLISKSRLDSCSHTNRMCPVSIVSWPMSCNGVGDVMNMTDLGREESCPDTIFTAVRSSIESPKDITSRPAMIFPPRPLPRSLLLRLFDPERENILLQDISCSSPDEADSSEDSSVETMESQEVSIVSDPALHESSASSPSVNISFTSWANAAAFQQRGWPG
mmetsp:Transcript_16112/g.33077  ORF Transcript_16112/g.33077 Transcript_16112/m.33077 type:complete len:208 (+) Transcript_16112:260-883(+)